MSRALQTSGGVLTRLRKDVRGNTLAMMAAMLIPLLAFSGAAIDMARLYVVKVRLQQACDAGALAGRKALKDTSKNTAIDQATKDQAQAFFKNNFQTGWYQNTNTVFTPVKATVGADSTVANAITGTATTTVPLKVMRLFGTNSTTINVSCQAVYDLADTDVMFVLDTTGSMSVVPSSGGEGGALTYTRDDGTQAIMRQEQSGSKIEALRKAVILFDSTMTQNKQADTVVRYGFSPYSTVVNIGKLLPASSVTTNLNYNTRKNVGDYDYITNVAYTAPIPQVNCLTNKRFPATGYGTGFYYLLTGSNNPSQAVQASGYYSFVQYTGNTSWSSDNGGTCTGPATIKRALWNYGSWPLNVTPYLTQASVPTPGRIDGSTSKWRGCVELATVSNATALDAGSLPSDLDPDVMPDWRPMWPEAVWYYKNVSNNVKDQDVSNDPGTYKALSANESNDSVTCPMEAKTLGAMTAKQVNDYVYATNFKAAGNTYHDYGMSWGLRMLSTKGPFASSVAPASGRKQPTQNIVFMTDGAPVADTDNYQMYGIEGLDKRLTGGSNIEAAQHVRRLRVLCDAAKQRGITIYMIAFGTTLTDDMKYCASPGQSFSAQDNDALSDAFKAIAKRIAMLRINQ